MEDFEFYLDLIIRCVPGLFASVFAIVMAIRQRKYNVVTKEVEKLIDTGENVAKKIQGADNMDKRVTEREVKTIEKSLTLTLNKEEAKRLHDALIISGRAQEVEEVINALNEVLEG